MKKALSQFISFGFPSNLSSKLDSKKLSITLCKKLNITSLKSKFGLTKQEAELIKAFLKRKPIPSDVLYKVLDKNNFTCCICNGLKSDSYIIHHINLNSADNNPRNLAVLCPNDHDLAHKEGFMVTRRLEANEVSAAKFKWERAVREQRKTASKKPNSDKAWKELADKIANYVHNYLFQAHRGVIRYDKKISVVFGNDGYSDKRNDNVKREIISVRDFLDKKKIKELSFGLCNYKYSWCIIVETNKIAVLNKILWSSFPVGGSNNYTQESTSQIQAGSYLANYLSEFM